MEGWTVEKLGIVGVVIVVLARTIQYLWKTGRDDTKEARAERDALLKEREAMRLAHMQQLGKLELDHANELAKLREEMNAVIAQLREQSRDERLDERDRYAATLERLFDKVASLTQNIEITLAKSLDRLASPQKKG